MHPLVVNKRSGEPFDVYVGRPTKFGNPFSHRADTLAQFVVGSVDEAVEKYRGWLWSEIRAGRITVEELAEMAGKRLACWCAPGPCHAEVLVLAAFWAEGVLNRREVIA